MIHQLTFNPISFLKSDDNMFNENNKVHCHYLNKMVNFMTFLFSAHFRYYLFHSGIYALISCKISRVVRALHRQTIHRINRFRLDNSFNDNWQNWYNV